MDIMIKKSNGLTIAIVQNPDPIITDVQSALDFFMTVCYEKGCDCIAIYKSAIIEDFFDLSTCIAGEILQKCINYHIKFAIIGDFQTYSSKSLQAFIYESNKGKDIFFVSSEQQAIDMLTA